MIYNKLYRFQKRLVRKIDKKESAGIFADMGLGKTLMSLSRIERQGFTENNKLLIICKKAKIQDWVDDLKKELNIVAGPVHGDIKPIKKRNDIKNNFNALVMNFEIAWKYENLFRWIDSNTFIIIDESQYIKSFKAKVTKFCLKLRNKTTKITLLSGTPIDNGYIDLYTQLKMLGWNMNLTNFKKQYCIMETDYANGGFTKIVGYKNVDELMKITHDFCVFKKTEDVKDLEFPEQIFIDVNIKKKPIYDKFIKDRILDDYKAKTAATLSMYAIQLTSGFLGNAQLFHEYESNKKEHLKTILRQTNSRVLIFHKYTPEMELIVDICEQLKRPYSIHSGEKKDLSALQYDNGIIIGSYQATAESIDELKVINYTIYFSATHSFKLFSQSIKRTHRIGQKNTCFYYLFKTQGTKELDVYDCLQNKKDYDYRLFKEVK